MLNYLLQYPHGPSAIPLDDLPFSENNVKVPTKHIISIEDITINKELGMGQFGVVQQGTWTTGNQRVSNIIIYNGFLVLDLLPKIVVPINNFESEQDRFRYAFEYNYIEHLYI